MDPLFVLAIALATALLAATAYMEWIGVLNLFTGRGIPRYDACGHLRFTATTHNDRCWRCRHTVEHRLDFEAVVDPRHEPRPSVEIVRGGRRGSA